MPQSKSKMKAWYDKCARHRKFRSEDPVLVLLPFRGSPLLAKFSDPKRIAKKVSPTNYVVTTPERSCLQRLCHFSMLQPYHTNIKPDKPRSNPVPVCVADAVPDEDEEEQIIEDDEDDEASPLSIPSVKA